MDFQVAEPRAQDEYISDQCAQLIEAQIDLLVRSKSLRKTAFELRSEARELRELAKTYRSKDN